MNLLILLLFPILSFADGVGHIGGGGAVICYAQPPKFVTSDVYVLDYALTFPREPHELAPVATVGDSVERIRKLLAKNLPEALASFNDFFASVDVNSTLNPHLFRNTATRVWWAADGPIEKIDDVFIRMFPPNCRRGGAGPFSDPYSFYAQLIVRSRLGAVVRYRYNDLFVSSFFTHQPLQASILMVHEWLWDFYEGQNVAAPRIRNANAFLHSLAADTATPEEFKHRVFSANPGTFVEEGNL